AVADREEPRAVRIELAQDLQHPPVVPQVLGRAPADADRRDVVRRDDVGEREVRVHRVPRHLLVGIPAGLEVVHDEMQAALGGGGDAHVVPRFLEALPREPGLEALAAVAGDDQDHDSSASLQYWTHLAISAIRSEPAGTAYSHSMIASISHLLSRIT